MKYVIGIPLIFALLLSVLNAIMGVARSLFQASEDRLFPKFFEHKNKHHVPDRAMAFNVVCAIVVALFGSPVRIYIFSNVGYIVAVAASMYGYFLLRQFRPEHGQPVPHAGLLPVDRAGHARCSSPSTTSSEDGTRPTSWWDPARATSSTSSGLVIVAGYVPLYLWRKMTDKRRGPRRLGLDARWSSGPPAASTSTTAR